MLRVARHASTAADPLARALHAASTQATYNGPMRATAAPHGPAESAPAVRLAEIIAALSLASDLGTGQPFERGIRASLVAVRLADRLGLGEADRSDTYYLPLVAMLGCTAGSSTAAEVLGDELAFGASVAPLFLGQPRETAGWMLRHFAEDQPPLRRVRKLARALAGAPRVMAQASVAHCEVAQRLTDRLGFGAGLRAALGAIYARWDGSGSPRLRGEAIPLATRIMHVAWDAQLFHRLGGPAACVDTARRRASRALDPGVVDVLCRDAGTVLDVLAAPSLWDAVLAAEPGRPRVLPPAHLDDATAVFADFTDLKSVYTHGHSRQVASIASDAARRYGLGETDVAAVQRAGLVHDLGRVAVSSSVWEKAGPLGEGEREQVRLHPYYTERILARATPLAPLASLAGAHHERLDGSGYHRGSSGAVLPPAARILAAADIYQALTAPRPHRPPHSPEQAAGVLREEVRRGHLDGEVAGAVLAAAGHRVRSARRSYPAGLSEREVEVLRLIAQGHTNRQMAGSLAITESTVHHHVQHIYDKLGVSTRAAATLFALQHDLVR